MDALCHGMVDAFNLFKIGNTGAFQNEKSLEGPGPGMAQRITTV